MLDNKFFDIIDSEAKAYYLGLFTADGCNYENTGIFKIDLSIRDEEILRNFTNITGCDTTLKYYTHSDYTIKTFGDSKEYKCQPTVRLSFTSRHISEQLAKKGCIAHKSTCGTFIRPGIIPDELFHHYVRGLIDGDGGIGYWEDNPETHHLKFQIHFCNTDDMVGGLAKYLGEKFNCHPNIAKRYKDRNNNNSQFCISGNIVVEKILDWLYKDSTIYLSRKYERYLLLKKERDRRRNNTQTYGNAYKKRPVKNVSTGIIYPSVTKAAKENHISPSAVTNKCKVGIEYIYC